MKLQYPAVAFKLQLAILLNSKSAQQHFLNPHNNDIVKLHNHPATATAAAAAAAAQHHNSIIQLKQIAILYYY